MDSLALHDADKGDPASCYTTGETPFKYIDGWYLGSFVWRAYKELRVEAAELVTAPADVVEEEMGSG